MRFTTAAALAATTLSSCVSAVPKPLLDKQASAEAAGVITSAPAQISQSVVYLDEDDEETVYDDTEPSTIYGTQTTTILSCPESVTNCPVRSKTPVVVSSVIPVSVVKVTEKAGSLVSKTSVIPTSTGSTPSIVTYSRISDGPVDSATSYVKIIVSSKTNEAGSVVSSVTSYVESVISSKTNDVGNGINSETSYAKSVISSKTNDIGNGISSATSYISSKTNDVGNGISSATSYADSVIASKTEKAGNDLSSATSYTGSLISSVTSSAESVLSSKTKDVGNEVSSATSYAGSIVSSKTSHVESFASSATSYIESAINGPSVPSYGAPTSDVSLPVFTPTIQTEAPLPTSSSQRPPASSTSSSGGVYGYLSSKFWGGSSSTSSDKSHAIPTSSSGNAWLGWYQHTTSATTSVDYAPASTPNPIQTSPKKSYASSTPSSEKHWYDGWHHTTSSATQTSPSASCESSTSSSKKGSLDWLCPSWLCHSSSSTSPIDCIPTSSIPAQSTQLPVGDDSGAVPSASDSYSATALTVLTIYAKHTHKVTRCAPTVTNCGAIVTDIIVVSTTRCPAHDAASATSAVLSEASGRGMTGIEPITAPFTLSAGASNVVYGGYSFSSGVPQYGYPTGLPTSGGSAPSGALPYGIYPPSGGLPSGIYSAESLPISSGSALPPIVYQPSGSGSPGNFPGVPSGSYPTSSGSDIPSGIYPTYSSPSIPFGSGYPANTGPIIPSEIYPTYAGPVLSFQPKSGSGVPSGTSLTYASPGVPSQNSPPNSGFSPSGYPTYASPSLPSSAPLYDSTFTTSATSVPYFMAMKGMLESQTYAPTDSLVPTTTLTILATSIYTVTPADCAPSTTECPSTLASEVLTITSTVSVATTICPVTEMSSAVSAAMSQASAAGLVGYGAMLTSSSAHDNQDDEDFSFASESFSQPGETVNEDGTQYSHQQSDSSSYHDIYRDGDVSGERQGGGYHKSSYSQENGLKKIIKSSITGSSAAATETSNIFSSPLTFTGRLASMAAARASKAADVPDKRTIPSREDW